MEGKVDNEAKKFLQAEKTAVEIAETLKKLRSETESYQDTQRNLSAVRKDLTHLIQSTEVAVKGSQEVISMLKEIGGPEIFQKLDDLKNVTSEMLQQQTGKISKLKTFVVITFSVSLIAVIIEILNILLKYF
jgi:hypothetical protein